MTLYAQINGTLIGEVVKVDPYTIFDKSYASSFIQIPEDVNYNFKPGWTYINGKFIPPPEPTQQEIEEKNKNKNKSIALNLLSQTDWVQLGDVSNTEITPHLLNKPEFDEYRRLLRVIVLNPPSELNISWPTLPQEQWSS